LKIGIIGKRGSGKTTIFSLLTGTHDLSQKGGYSLGVAPLPDSRVDFLSEMYKPKKTTYAQLSVLDFASLGSSARDSEAAKQAKTVDALLLVLGAFIGDPLKDLDEVLSELVISDLAQVERLLERIEGKRFASQEEVATLQRCKDSLENGALIGADRQRPGEVELLSNDYNLITTKPIIVALNAPEDSLMSDGDYQDLSERCEALGLPVVRFCATVEADIMAMETADERRMFMEEYGLTESGLSRLARNAYARLGLISFFTVGQDEVRAWTVPVDCPAKKAAGVIHSDIERGFIRAEVVGYQDMKRLLSMKAIKEAGLFRLEAKEYPVKDGDIISFRFNV